MSTISLTPQTVTDTRQASARSVWLAVAILVGRRHLPAGAPSAAGERPDVASVALSMLGGFGLIYPLIEGRADGWPVWCVALLAVGVLSFAAFLVRQRVRARHGATPLVEPALFTRRPFVAGLAVVVCFIAAMGGMVIALNVMFQTGLGRSPLACGIATLPIPLAAIAGSITSSALLARIGRMTMQLGMSLGIAVVGTVMFDHLGARITPGGFVAAAQPGLLVAVAFLVAACVAVLWLPRHARAGAGH